MHKNKIVWFLQMNKISVKIKTQQKSWNLNSKIDTDENYVN